MLDGRAGPSSREAAMFRRKPQVVIIQQPKSQVIPGLASIFLPGFGHLMQGRFFSGLAWFFLLTAAFVSVFLVRFGIVAFPILWLVCIHDAWTYQPRR
jgi:hypothetical protein